MYNGLYSKEDILLIEKNGLTLEKVDTQWKLFPDQDLVTVIGSLEILAKGEGQERNEPFTQAEQASE